MIHLQFCYFFDNSAGEKGGGYCGDSGSALSDCELRGNRARFGGGLRARGGLVERCIVARNRASEDGGGIYGRCNSIRHCVVRDNSAVGDGGGVFLDDSELIRCLITGNRARRGGGVRGDLVPSAIDGATITGNQAEIGAGISVKIPGGYLTLANSIVWGNHGTEIHPESGYYLRVEYTLVEGGWPGIGNIDADPLFRAYSGFDHLLGPGSPAIDAGDPGLIDAIYDWHPRWPAGVANGERGDMGAYGGPENREWVVLVTDDERGTQ